jgi:hypothetical protein
LLRQKLYAVEIAAEITFTSRHCNTILSLHQAACDLAPSQTSDTEDECPRQKAMKKISTHRRSFSFANALHFFSVAVHRVSVAADYVKGVRQRFIDETRR